jgi:hypothetical protein
MNPAQLLDQAERLAETGVGRPRQTDLRRAVSTAYYALFHLLTQDGARHISTNPELQPLVARAFGHGEMKQVSDLFARNRLPDHLSRLVPVMPADLQVVADAFFQLQEARHRADYDIRPDRGFRREEARTQIRRAREAFEAWQRVREDPAAEVYLLALLLHRLWGR